MPLTTTLVFAIRPLAYVSRSEKGVQLTFRDGSVAHLDNTHPHFDSLQMLVDKEARGARPLGFVLDPSSRVLDVNEAHDVTVRYLREQEDTPDRLKVALWGFSPICYLAKDHPEFDRISSTLTAAAGTPTRLWVANHSQMVQDDPPLADGEFEIWWKILDVRPCREPSHSSTNGTVE